MINRRMREQPSSLSFRMVILTVLPMLMLTTLLIVYNAHAITALRENTYEVNSRALNTYMDNVDESMRTMEYYWVGLKASSNLLTLITTSKSSNYYIAMSRLKADMEGVVQSYRFVDDLFVYVEGKAEYFDAPKYSLSTEERRDIRALVTAESTRQGVLDGVDNQWRPVQMDGRYYLLRMFRVQDAYMGGCVSVSRLLTTMREGGFSEVDFLSFFSSDGSELGTVLCGMVPTLDIGETSRYAATKLGGRDYLAITRPSRYGSYSAVILISDIGVREGLRSFWVIIALWGGCIAVFLAVFITLIRRWLLSPMKRLCEAMEGLRSGDLDVRVRTGKGTCAEFALVNETFDDMSSNMKALKIDVYEQYSQRQAAEIRQKGTELQYMKEQMRPHFYINCLNVINNLSLMGKNGQICEMTAYLSNQLRHMMSERTLDTLRHELDFVENYLRIQQLCHGDHVRAHIEVDPSIEDVPVPPLILMTFVENVCKHQAMAGGRTDIYIVCAECEEPRQDEIRIEVWDAGDGYSEEILGCIRDGSPLIDGRGEHFGIRNIIARLRLIYSGREMVEIGNHWETGGAYALIELPKCCEQETEVPQ